MGKEEAIDSRTSSITAVQLIARHNYPVETHIVITQDGYVLTIFRIPSSNHCTRSGTKPVVLLQHGINFAADGFLVTGPKTGLPYLLADACFDVWLSNCRGTRYSRRHTTLRVSEQKFWQFSFHEMGIQDLPAQINYILLKTKQNALHFVCYSEGCSAGMVLLSMKPEYNGKIKTANLLAPTVFMKHSKSWGLQLLKPLFMKLPDAQWSGLYGAAAINTSRCAIAMKLLPKI
nr:lipase 1-like [Drosophila takahashii]